MLFILLVFIKSSLFLPNVDWVGLIREEHCLIMCIGYKIDIANSILLLLIGYLYMSGMWLSVDSRTETPKTHVFKRHWTQCS